MNKGPGGWAQDRHPTRGLASCSLGFLAGPKGFPGTSSPRAFSAGSLARPIRAAGEYLHQTLADQDLLSPQGSFLRGVWGSSPRSTATTSRKVGGCRTLQTDGREVRRPRGGSQRGALAGPRILSTSGSAGSARGGWWLHRLGGGGCCSSPSLPQRLEAALGQSRGGLRLHGGVLSTAPAVSCGPGGDRRGAGEGGWDRCQQHVSPPAPPGWGLCPVPGPKVTGAQKMRLKLKGWAHVELGVLAEGPPSGYHARV